jgi:hypothetical protein
MTFVVQDNHTARANNYLKHFDTGQHKRNRPTQNSWVTRLLFRCEYLGDFVSLPEKDRVIIFYIHNHPNIPLTSKQLQIQSSSLNEVRLGLQSWAVDAQTKSTSACLIIARGHDQQQ